MNCKNIPWLLLVPALLLGCGKGSDNTAAQKKPEANKPAEAAKQPAESGKPGAPVPVTTLKPNASPEETVQYISQGLANYQPAVLWNSLPASYQKDASGLVTEFAGKMDKDVWNKSFALAGKSVTVLKTQKKMVIDQLGIFLPPNVDRKQLSENWDAIADILLTIVNSELGNLDELKKGDVEKLLSGSGAKLLKQTEVFGRLMDQSKTKPGQKIPTTIPEAAKAVKVTVLKKDDKQATLKVETEGRKETEELVLVNVEGKWVPKEMADGWSKAMEGARNGLSQIRPETVSQYKPVILKGIDAIDKKLDVLAAAKTSEEFQKGIEGLMQTVTELSKTK